MRILTCQWFGQWLGETRMLPPGTSSVPRLSFLFIPPTQRTCYVPGSILESMEMSGRPTLELFPLRVVSSLPSGSAYQDGKGSRDMSSTFPLYPQHKKIPSMVRFLVWSLSGGRRAITLLSRTSSHRLWSLWIRLHPCEICNYLRYSKSFTLDFLT